MNISAHPLVVAVALGLLGPSVLREEAEERCGDCSCGEQPDCEVVGEAAGWLEPVADEG